MDTVPKTMFWKIRNYFQYSLPTDWKNTKLTVLYVEYPPYVIDINSTDHQGIEMSLINVIMSHLKVNVSYVKSDFDYWGEIENETFINSWGELQSRQFDFAFDMSVAYLDDSVKFVAPKAKLQDNINTLTGAFQISVWIMYFSSLFQLFC